MLYPVCVHQADGGSLGATIPDFPGCFSGADDGQVRVSPCVAQPASDAHARWIRMHASSSRSVANA